MANNIPFHKENAFLSESVLLDKVLMILINMHGKISAAELSKLLFESVQGDGLDLRLYHLTKQLEDMELVEIETSTTHPHKMMSTYYSLTGKGIFLCKRRRCLFKERPLLYSRVLNITEIVFTKYLPIIISSMALLVALLTYIWVTKPRSQPTQPPTNGNKTVKVK